MRTKFLIAIAFTLASLANAIAQEPDKRSPIDRYRGDTVYTLMMCQISFYNAQTNAMVDKAQDQASDYESCIEKGKGTTKLAFDAALRTIRKPAAVEALKAHHVAFVTALQGIRPAVEERKGAYRQRQQVLEERLTATWARIEIEQ